MTSLPFEDLPKQPLEIEDFDSFWAAYPRKVGRYAALLAYRKAFKRAGHTDLMAGLRKYLQFKPAYADWCHPTTWLNQGRWMDEPDTLPAMKGGIVGGPRTLEALTIIAEHVKRPWCERGAYSRDVLEQCVAAELLTVDEMEAVL